MNGDERENAQERLRQSLLMGKFAGIIMQDEIKAELEGIRAFQNGLNYNANPYARPDLRIHWVEGYGTRSNMRYPTYKGSAPRIQKPPKGKIV